MGVGRTFQVVRSFPRLPLLDNVIVGAYGAGLLGSARPSMRRCARCIASACCNAPGVAGRATDQQAVASDGTGPRAGRPSAAVAAGRDAGRPGPRGVRRRAGRAAPLRDEGMTIAIIEHTMHAMMRMADRFVVLDHGAVLASGLPRDGGGGQIGDRGLSRQEMAGAAGCLRSRNLSVVLWRPARADRRVAVRLRGAVRHGRRAQRRRQIDTVQDDLRRRPTGAGHDHVPGSGSAVACPPRNARIWASRMSRRGGRCSRH